MKKLSMIILIFLGFFMISEAQTEREKAIELKNQAIELMDNGKIDEWIYRSKLTPFPPHKNSMISA